MSSDEPNKNNSIDPFDPDQSFGFLLHDAARFLRKAFDRKVQTLGLTQAQSRVLAHLSLREGITQAALADILELQPITLARTLDRMESASLVERRPDPGDRRAVNLYLGPGAMPVLEEMWKRAASIREFVTDGISEQDFEIFRKTLITIRSNLLAGELPKTAGAEEKVEEEKQLGTAHGR